jgi:hypothetical protein
MFTTISSTFRIGVTKLRTQVVPFNLLQPCNEWRREVQVINRVTSREGAILGVAGGSSRDTLPASDFTQIPHPRKHAINNVVRLVLLVSQKDVHNLRVIHLTERLRRFAMALNKFAVDPLVDGMPGSLAYVFNPTGGWPEAVEATPAIHELNSASQRIASILGPAMEKFGVEPQRRSST